MRLADEMNFACMVVGENDLAVYNSNDKVDVIFRQMLNVQNLKENVPMEPILKQRILQLTPIISDAEERIIMPHLTGCISSRWYPDFIDITAQNVDKGYGLLSIAFHQGIKIEDTMAFGDGGNDIPIIKRAGIGIAMGNANQDLKEIADYITSSVDDNGIYNALKHFII
jgi:HAD superfamily hydrolase (TIGR01484 family)